MKFGTLASTILYFWLVKFEIYHENTWKKKKLYHNSVIYESQQFAKRVQQKVFKELYYKQLKAVWTENITRNE